MESSIKIDRHSVEITHPDRILFPADGITKGELIAYYRDIAPYMLEYTKDRPLSMHRFPEGIKHEGFFQKNSADYFPEWIKKVAIGKSDGGVVKHVVANNAATLIYIANQACITPHLWLSKIDKLRYPDRLIFDLDPSGDDFNLVRTTALALKDFLEDELGLPTFVMTTGSRGLHVMVPIKRLLDFDDVHDFAHDVARVIVARLPKECTLAMHVHERRGKLFIDYLRNSYAATTVAPYAVRAKAGAPIATPILWDEVADRKLTSQRYTIKNIFKRLDALHDPWHGVIKHACSLTKARKILDVIMHDESCD